MQPQSDPDDTIVLPGVAEAIETPGAGRETRTITETVERRLVARPAP